MRSEYGSAGTANKTRANRSKTYVDETSDEDEIESRDKVSQEHFMSGAINTDKIVGINQSGSLNPTAKTNSDPNGDRKCETAAEKSPAVAKVRKEVYRPSTSSLRPAYIPQGPDHIYGPYIFRRLHNIAAREGPKLVDNLEELAFELAKADKVIVDFNVLYLESKNTGSMPPVTLHQLQRVATELEECGVELTHCIDGSDNFHQEYLSTDALLKFWNFHRTVQKATIDRKAVTSSPTLSKMAGRQPSLWFKEKPSSRLEEILPFIFNYKFSSIPIEYANVVLTGDGIVNPKFQQLETTFQPLIRHFEVAIKRNLLTEKQQKMIQRRYDVLDDIFRSLESVRSSLVFPRKTSSWAKLAEQFGLSSERKRKQMDWTSMIMWATVVLSGIGSMPTFAMGLKYSKPDPGRKDDADFWFLLQICLTSFLGIVTLAIPLSQNHLLYTSNIVAAWGSIAVALGFVIFAPFLYLGVSTAWAMFLTIIAGMFQAWLVVQIAIEARDRRKEKECKHLKAE